MAWLYIVALAVCAGIFLWIRLQKSNRIGIGKAAAILEPGNYITIHWLALFVLEASLVQLDPGNSQFHLAAMSDSARTAAVEQAVLYGLVGYLFFSAGYLLPLRRLTSRMLYFKINRVAPVVRRGVIWTLLAIGLVGISIFGVSGTYALVTGQVNRLFATQGQGYLFFLVQAWSIGLIISYAYLRFNGRRSWWITAAYFAAVLPMMAFGRTKFLFVWLAYIVIAAFSRNPPKARRLILFALGIVAIAAVLLVIRRAGGFGEDVLADTTQNYWIGTIRHTFVSFDNFSNYLTVQSAFYWKQFGPGYFFSFVLYGLPGSGFVPYTYTIPQTLMTYIYGGNGGAPFTILGISNAAAGPIGMIAFMFFLGMLTKILWEYVCGRRYQISAVLILAIFDSRIHEILWGSYLSGMLEFVQTYLLLAIGLIFLSGGVLYRPVPREPLYLRPIK